MDWTNFFSEVPDFRLNRRKRYLLSDILMIALCAVVSGADDCEEIAEYGRQKLDFLRQFLTLSNGAPSHDTFNRVLKYLDKQAFGESLHTWSRQLIEQLNLYQVAIDGKVLRSTAKAGQKRSGLCIVSAWAAENRLVLGQQAVAGKSNEKTAIPALIDSLDLRGAVVSIDAIACQKTIALQLVEKKAEFVLALKNNQKGLYEQVWHHLQTQQSILAAHTEYDMGSGRLEKRTAYVCSDLSLVDDLQGWAGVKSIVWIESHREKNGQTTVEHRLYLSSLEASAKFMLDLTRSHWGIENSLHWQLDVVFREDRQRIREGNGAQNMATLRKLALQLFHQAPDKESVKTRRKRAAWNDQYLITLLQSL
jgi:predicted transposase YbfD/YdcC